MTHLDLLKPLINIPLIDDPEDQLEDRLIGELDNHINNLTYDVCFAADEVFEFVNISRRQRFFYGEGEPTLLRLGE